MVDNKIVNYERTNYREFWEGDLRAQRDFEFACEESVVSKMLVPSHGWFIDIGAGYGRLTHQYIGRFSKVVIADYAVSLLREARDLLERNEGTKASFIALNVYRLPFRDASFTAGLMVRVLHHLNNHNAVAAELYRVFANGTSLLTSDMNSNGAFFV